MSRHRVALANLRFPATPETAVKFTVEAIKQAAAEKADIICFPECYVPGYRAKEKNVPPPDTSFLERAWSAIAGAASSSQVSVVLGTERVVDGRLLATVLVIDRDGKRLGFQDKVQLDPSEEGLYAAGDGRQVFASGGLVFGVVICHEGWRYPETVRWAAQRGAHIVFHPHFGEFEPGAYVPTTFADPRNTFHEKAALCRAAENTCYFATVNFASEASPSTSAVAKPRRDRACLATVWEGGFAFGGYRHRRSHGPASHQMQNGGSCRLNHQLNQAPCFQYFTFFRARSALKSRPHSRFYRCPPAGIRPDRQATIHQSHALLHADQSEPMSV